MPPVARKPHSKPKAIVARLRQIKVARSNEPSLSWFSKKGVFQMLDFIFLAGVVAVFILTIGYAYACDRL